MSRELDAEVAEKVMGVPFNAMTQRGFTGSIYAETPHYSTDIAAAIQVVERINTNPEYCREGYRLSMHGPFDDGWSVEVFWQHHDGEILEAEVVEKTLPLAICKAALEAMKHG